MAGAAPPPAPGCCSSACSCPSSRSPRPSPPCAPCRSPLGVAPADLSWVSSTYTLVVAAGVLSGGAFGERYGRRRVFLLGVAALAAGSLAVAVSDGFAQVLAGRSAASAGPWSCPPPSP
ncbi:MFS transporter [Streptomyces werraensis]|uniref:MFS transporter n=1 Tax=Streptomyces werraensis TaxID=68284 RepID=UPI003823C905